MTPTEEKRQAKLERDNVLFILAALFRAASINNPSPLLRGAQDSFDAAEEQLKEAEKRGIAVTKLP